MSTVRPVAERRGWAVTLAVVLLKPLALLISRRRWLNGTRIPASGGCILVANHISHLEPILWAHLIYDHGRIPRALGKDSLFELPVIGRILRSAGQIPVKRGTRNAATAFAAAMAAVRRGDCLMVYPEGTITKDPDGWPMAGKTGAARIALATGAPLVPIGQWGAQEILPAYSRRLRLLPRRTVSFSVGEPVDLSDLAGDPDSAEAIAEATRRMMAAITAEVELLRGERRPDAA